MTEMKLKTEVLTGANQGLMTEKKNLAVELKETKHLYVTYESKCSEIMVDLNTMNAEYQELKRSNLTFDETNKSKDSQIKKLSKDIKDL